MKRSFYNEQRERGNFFFPVEYHYVTNHHPRYNMPYHWHIQYEILRVLQGHIVISVDDEEYTVKQGEILFIPEGAVHGGKAFLEDTIYECIVFDKKLFETDIGESGMLQKFFDHQIIINKHYTAKQTVIKKLVWLMFRTIKNQYEGFEYIVKGSILTFFGLVLKNKLYTLSLTNFANNNQRNIHKLKKSLPLNRNII
ncbi:cupin domain-containing protein [Megamonas sp.]